MLEKPKPSRILGVDYGLRRLGLSLSDERKVVAMPLRSLLAEKRLENTVKKLIEVIEEIQREYQCQIERIIIGLPLMMSGKTGLIADEVKYFVSVFESLSPCSILMWDERLSTAQAERALRETQLSRKRRTAMVDTVSAVMILQSYLDSLSAHP